MEYLLPKDFSEEYIVVDDVVYFIYANDDDSTFNYANIDLKKLP
jgi:hypothetical protein